MKNKLVLDVETTTLNKGNPFTRKNRCIVVGLLNVDTNEETKYWLPNIDGLQKQIDNSELLIGFNIKFDLHWLRRIGINISLLQHKIWDCQLAEFILEGQSNPYPSLNQALTKYNLPLKLDIVKEQYWDKGIDTADIPKEILDSYLSGDLKSTLEVYKFQELQLTENKQLNLFKLQCLDLLVLEDMEWNGIYFNEDKALELAEQEEERVKAYEQELKRGYETIPINWDSKDHLSCYLYGGTITETQRYPVGVYKSGQKLGQPRYKLIDYEYKLPQLVKPLPGSELKKEGYYATNDQILRSIKGTREVRNRINTILERSKSVKLSGTYYRGLPKLIEEMDWPKQKLHGQFNQCVVTTGRLSSNKPNLQNFAGQVKQLLESRYV